MEDKNSIEETIDKLHGSVTMMRSQVIYASLLSEKVTELVKRGTLSKHDIVAYTSKLLKAVVAEAYIEGETAAFDKLQGSIFTARAETLSYGSGVLDDVNGYLEDAVTD